MNNTIKNLLRLLLYNFILYTVAFPIVYFIREYYNISYDSFFGGIVNLIAYIWVAISICIVILMFYMIVTIDNKQ